MKQTSLTNKEFKVVELALAGLNQNEISRQLGLHRVSGHRLVNRPHIQQQIEELRAASMVKAWGQFDELLTEALSQLLALLRSPLIERRERIRIGLKVLELGLAGGVIPQQAITILTTDGGAALNERRASGADGAAAALGAIASGGAAGGHQYNDNRQHNDDAAEKVFSLQEQRRFQSDDESMEDTGNKFPIIREAVRAQAR